MPTASTFALLLLLTSAPQPLTGPGGDDRHPEPSPDGGLIVFESNRDGDWNLYLMRADGSHPRPLTSGPAADRFATWTPAGDHVLFQSDRGGGPALYLVSIRDGAVILVGGGDHGGGENSSAEMVPDIAPDGSTVAFTAEHDGNIDLYALHLGYGKRGQVERLTQSAQRDVWPRFSPGGDRLVFFSRRETAGEDDEIYLRDQEHGTVRRLTRRPGHDFCPSFSPDGRSIVAAARDEAGTRRWLEILDLEGGERHRLGLGFERVTHPSWSPAGDRIYFAARPPDGDYDIYVETLPAGVRSAPLAEASCCDERRRRTWLMMCVVAALEKSGREPAYSSDSDLAGTVVTSCDAQVATASQPETFRRLARSLVCCSADQRRAWLADCEADARRIRPGMPVSALGESFEHDGGLSWEGFGRWVHKRCREIKLEVHYGSSPNEPPGMITEVIGPYVDLMTAD